MFPLMNGILDYRRYFDPRASACNNFSLGPIDLVEIRRRGVRTDYLISWA